MSARRWPLTTLTAPLVAGVVMVLLMLTPATALPASDLSDASVEIVLTAELAADLSDAAHVRAMPCAKIGVPPPSRPHCHHAVGATVALRRQRSEVDGIAFGPPALSLSRLLVGDDSQPPLQIETRRPKPPWRGARAPFWAVFAFAPQLRN